MPLDPNIIMKLDTTGIDPVEAERKNVVLRSLKQKGALDDLTLDQARREAADDAATRQAYMGGGDAAAVRARLAGSGSYKALMAHDKAQMENEAKKAAIEKDKAAAGKSNYDVEIGKVQHVSSVLAEVQKDPTMYSSAVRLLGATFGPQFVADAPAQYDPAYVASKIAAGQTITQKLEDQRKREQNAETGRHNVATEQNTVRGQNLTATTAREGHRVTERGQDLTDSRARQTLEEGRWVNDLTRGIQVNSATGESRPITAAGAPIAPREDAPEAMLKAAGYADRMKKASGLLDKFADSGKPGVIESVAGQRAGGVPANVSRSPERQQYHQAAEDWVRAKLRQESGAVIADEEMAREIRTYFPVIGDRPEVIAQKAQARKTAEQAMVTAAGRAKGAISDKAVRISGDDGYNALPKGARYVGPDGVERVK